MKPIINVCNRFAVNYRERVIPLVAVGVQPIAMIEKDVTEKVEIHQDQMEILVMEVLQMESALAHQGFPRKRKIIMVHKTGRRLLILNIFKITSDFKMSPKSTLKSYSF